MKSYTLDQFLTLKPKKREELTRVSISTLKTATRIDNVEFAFSECVNLTHLCIENNDMSECHLIFADILRACSACKKLDHLQISRNRLGHLKNYQLRRILLLISSLNQVRKLTMNHNDFERLDEFGWILLLSIPAYCSLERWDFCSNNLQQYSHKFIESYHSVVCSSDTLEEAAFEPQYLNRLCNSQWAAFLSNLTYSRLKVLHMSPSSSLRNDRMDDLIFRLPDLYHIRGAKLTNEQERKLNERQPDADIFEELNSYLPSEPTGSRRRLQSVSSISSSTQAPPATSSPANPKKARHIRRLFAV